MLYLYAVIDQPEVAAALPRGLQDTGVDVQAFDGIGMVTGRLSSSPGRDTDNACRHMNVLTALMRECTVLPVRSGAIFESRDHLKHSLAAVHDAFAAALLRLRGHVELCVKATDRKPLILQPVLDGPQMPTVPNPGTGTETVKRYVTTGRVKSWQRIQRTRANEAIAATLSGAFAPVAAGQAWRPLPSAAGRTGVTAAVLVPRPRLQAFHQTLAGLRSGEPGLAFNCTGPWPPYSFGGKAGQILARWASRAEAPGRMAS